MGDAPSFFDMFITKAVAVLHKEASVPPWTQHKTAQAEELLHEFNHFFHPPIMQIIEDYMATNVIID